MIQTVLGMIAQGGLGYCQCHEHIFLREGQPARINPALCIEDSVRSLEELVRYRACGGSSIVDAQPVGCGRDAEVLADLSRGSGVYIIASTGFHRLLFYPENHWIFSWDEERLYELYLAELTGGMFAPCDIAPPLAQTDYLAGQIKTALDAEGLTPRYRALFCAAARAAKEANVPLMVHIEAGSDPLALADFLGKRGVPPEKTIFCHLDRSTPDEAVHRALCSRGVTLEYDTIARPKYRSEDDEAALICRMAALYPDQLLLSLDTTRLRLSSYGGGPGLCYLRESYIPNLQAMGLDEATLFRLFISNPGRLYSR